ncbi:Fez family zinc finger protein erm [Gryllus bimaculatus]|nr:Fez family zinc finger protein erm [Gryllus bimaculatus]
MALDIHCIENDPQRILGVKEEVVVTQELFPNADSRNSNASNIFLENESVGENRCILPILVDDTEFGVVNEVVGAEGLRVGASVIPNSNVEEEMVRREAIPLQSKMPSCSGRGRRGHMRFPTSENNDFNNVNDSMNNEVLLESDRRTTMHYIKYIKRDGKTFKLWECGICSKEFRHQYTLMRHLPTHTDERNFKCETCGKGFRQMSTLSQHRAIHSDARPYVCEVCTKTFNRVSTLISHRKTHSAHKPHKCHVCGKGFHQKGNLRNHIFTHTNERPYKCEVCSKGFNQMSNLMCHKVKAHSNGERVLYSCNICKLEFPRNGEKIENSRNYIPNNVSLHTLNKIEAEGSSNGQDTKSYPGIIIDAINTKAMMIARETGQTAFALLKLAKGSPVLVKVLCISHEKHMLIPASAEDLKTADEITISSNLDAAKNGSVRALHIKIPIVATVIQKADADGRITMHVESPGYNPDVNLFGDSNEAMRIAKQGSSMQIASTISSRPFMDCNSDNSSSENKIDAHSLDLINNHVNSDIQRFMNVENGSDIQFMCSSVNGMEYQVLSAEEAMQMMQQPVQTIEVVNDNINHIRQSHAMQENNLPDFVDEMCSDFQMHQGNNPMMITQSDLDSLGVAVNQQDLSFSNDGNLLPC